MTSALPSSVHRTALAGLASVLLTTGCGVPPTGVLDGGDPAGGLTQGMRLYFISPTGRLKAVPRPGIDPSGLRIPGDVIGLLMEGPTEEERAAGLTTLLKTQGFATSTDEDIPSAFFPTTPFDPSSVRDRNTMGQVVCSVARALAVADDDDTRRTDDFPVRVGARDAPTTSYVCSDFLK
ncbi:hypothetical protein [Streptomyces yaizuensis]|uniref:GerMN domain-containing protein n=1 Tax=Streptomyces yaizuensis TaxID=2989713 RepID=A0ABQ5PA18_9ACTN|nr:hypothetical protein [Streptomyces sp. YSPA8]GLF99439.1 GerMN domain-containing protein [Streptomyces sp. YSPA8]